MGRSSNRKWSKRVARLYKSGLRLHILGLFGQHPRFQRKLAAVVTLAERVGGRA